MIQRQLLWTSTRYGLKSYASVGKGLKIKARKCWGFIPTSVEVTGEKLVGGGGDFCSPPPIHSKVNLKLKAVNLNLQ